MIPNRQPCRICLEVGFQPIGHLKKPATALVIVCNTVDVVVAQTILCDRYGVVLETDGSVVIKHGNAGRIILSRVISLGSKKHVVLAQCVRTRARVNLRDLVPERQVALL